MITLSVECVQVTQPSGLSDSERVAALFRDLRQRGRLTQEDAAKRSNLTLSAYRGYEQGKRHLRTDQIARFAAVFGVPQELIVARLWPDESPLAAGLLGQLEAMGLDPEEEAQLAAEILADVATMAPGRERLDTLRALRTLIRPQSSR